MKTPMDDAVRVLADLANEGFSRGWDRLDRADKHDEIASAIGGIHAEWLVLQQQLAASQQETDRLRVLLDERRCDECGGEGERCFDRQDGGGNHYQEVASCPACNGDGRTEPGAQKKIAVLTATIVKSQVAAMAYAKAVDALGLAAPDSPEVLATANPIADAEFKLWKALGIDEEHPAVAELRQQAKEGGVEP